MKLKKYIKGYLWHFLIYALPAIIGWEFGKLLFKIR